MKRIDSEFSPNISHPYYFIRKGLKDSIFKYSQHLSGRMMDFGCGSKPYKSFFTISEYIGVDFENEGHPHHNEQIDVFYNGESLPFQANQFDSILSTEVFEHIFNLEIVLKELNRVLKTDGKILITCPFVWNEHEIPYDYARYTRFALFNLLKNTGFEVVEYSKAGDFITALFQLLILYFNNYYKGIVRKFFLFRWLYTFLFFIIPNLVGLLLIKLLPKNDSLYLNNVLVARKVLNNV